MIVDSPCAPTDPEAEYDGEVERYLLRWADLSFVALPVRVRQVSADGTRAISGPTRRYPSAAQIILHDLASGTQTVLSQSPTGDPANGWVLDPFLAANGASAVFSSSADNLPVPYPNPHQLLAWESGVLALATTSTNSELVLFDRLTGSADTVCDGVYPNCYRGLSPDGRWVAYSSVDGTRVLRDRTNGTESELPPVAGTGRVLFDHASQRMMYGTGLAYGTYQVFVRDLASGREIPLDVGSIAYNPIAPAAFGPGDMLAVTLDDVSILTTQDVIQADGFD